KLAKNRTPILLAEIGAYLHLIGRFSVDFIRANAVDSEKKFEYEEICNNPEFFENTGLNTLLKELSWYNLINDFKNLNNAGKLSSNKIQNFCDFIKKHRWKGDKPEEGLCRILADAHGIVSGIDKSLAGRGESGKQRKAYTFRATAFGYEKEIEFLGKSNLDEVDSKKVSEIKRELLSEIKEILERIKNDQSIIYEDYKCFVDTIKYYYSTTIGETRRPINEISLYDYAYTIASLMKSNLAKMVVDGWYEPRGKSKWRILKINIDVLGLLSEGLKIGDVLGYRSEIEKTYDKIKKIIEFEYPLGNEIYRDSTGIYFSCPDVDDVDKLKSEIIDKLKNLNKLDFSLQIEISDKNSRSMVILAKEREESLKRISYPHIGDIENLKKEFEESRNAGGEDICPICRIRLKPERDDRCRKCKERYEKRAKRWLNESDSFKETIWLDEVADKNDRVALIVGLFDLRKWLSGEFVGTFVSQIFDNWKDVCVNRDKNRKCIEKVSDVCSRLNIKNILDLERGFENLFNNPQSLNDDWKKICGSFIGKKPKDFINDFWNPIAERDATEKEALKLTDNSKKAKHLIKLLFRKHPSPARIYRIWNTTQEFINETIFENILKKHDWNSELRRQRIQFRIEPNPYIPEGATCDIDVDGLRFSPVCIDRQNGIFVSTINLEILRKFGESAVEIVENLNNKKIKLKTDKDITWEDGKAGRPFKITEAKSADEKFQNYLPYVKIYDYPDQFMVLVPAYEALDIAERILSEYEIQFSKVRDKLPFHLGIIAFHRKTPLYVVMDAGKRLLDAFKKESKTESAKVSAVEDVEDEKLGKNKELEIKIESHPSFSLKWRISYSTGDPDQEDLWHPYIRVDGDISDRN
ncbi:CRISPR-associated protein Csx11, partial [Persephonella sp.]